MNSRKLAIKNNFFTTNRAFLLYTMFFFICLVLATPYDRAWSLEWIQNATPLMKWWSRVVHQGVFINGRPGITDMTWVVLAWCIYKYYKNKPHDSLQNQAKYYIFFFSNTILLSIGLTRALKILFARPRPYGWSEKIGSFPYWYDFHQTFLPADQMISFHGSMPSGHTISMVCLIGTLPLLIKKPTWLRALIVALITFATLAVGFGRVIKQAHWITDCLCSGLFGGFLTWAHYRAFESIKPINNRKYLVNIIFISIGLIFIGVLGSLALHYTHKIY